MNNENLINLKERSKEERRRIAKMGAKASIKKRKEIKTLKEELLLLLDSTDDDGNTKRRKISISLIKEAEKGNTKAFELIQNITDGKPTYQVNVETKQIPLIIDDIGR